MPNSKVAGVDVLVKVKIASAWVVVGGQTGAKLARKASTIDVTSKSSGGWSEILPNLKEWGVDFDGFVTLGDAGIEALETAFNTNAQVEIELRVGAYTDAQGYSLSGKGYITDFPIEIPQDNAVTYSLSIAGATALTRTVAVDATPLA